AYLPGKDCGCCAKKGRLADRRSKLKGHPIMSFELTSSTFKRNDAIPKENTCDGSDISISLKWNEAPERTKSFALIADDPDAPRGTWVHWVLYDIPADIRELSGGVGH